MSTLWTGFNSSTDGQFPLGWEPKFYEGDFSVESVNGIKVLRHTIDGAQDEHTAIEWTEADNATQGEMAVRVRVLSGDLTLNNRLWIATNGIESTRSGWIASFGSGGTDTNESHRLSTFSEGSLVESSGTLGRVHDPLDFNTWYICVFNKDGNDLRMKWWRDEDAEPTSWGIEGTTAQTLSSGSFALGGGTRDTTSVIEYDWVGVSTDPSVPAPREAGFGTPTGWEFVATSVDDSPVLNGSWNSVTDSESYEYEIQRSTDGGSNWNSFDNEVTGSTSFTQTSSDGVQAGTMYRSRVRARR